MATPKDVIQEVKTVLEADATLSAYVKQVFLGIRESVARADHPCIMIEPGSNTETLLDVNSFVQNTIQVIVIATTHAYDLDARIVGDANYKGILDLENDIKKALSAKYPTLNGDAVNFRFGTTEFDLTRSDSDYPVRTLTMEVLIDYRSTFTGRT